MIHCLLLALLATVTTGGLHSQESNTGGAVVRFPEAAPAAFDESTRRWMVDTVHAVEREIRLLLPGLPQRIVVTIEHFDVDLTQVGGIAGRAEEPGFVTILVSDSSSADVGTLQSALKSSVFHEFHHLIRGWTISGNRFGPGIQIAIVNEGLAQVFAERYSGTSYARFDYPSNAEEWLQEVLALPVDASYNVWMNNHPDGRVAIGYRIGRYVVHQAMERSGLSILELSPLSPDEVLTLAGH